MSDSLVVPQRQHRQMTLTSLHHRFAIGGVPRSGDLPLETLVDQTCSSIPSRPLPARPRVFPINPIGLSAQPAGGWSHRGIANVRDGLAIPVGDKLTSLGVAKGGWDYAGRLRTSRISIPAEAANRRLQ
jgi:hypothetical protein